MNLADYSVEKLPWTNSNDSYPMWVGNTIYFLSDRNFTVNLFSYNLATKQLKQLTSHDDFDIMNASAGPDAIVYEQAGYVHLFDLKTGQARQLSIDATGDLPWAHPRIEKVASMVRASSLSPPAPARHLKRAATSSRSQPIKAIFGISPRPPARMTAARCGRPMVRRSPGCRMRAVNIN